MSDTNKPPITQDEILVQTQQVRMDMIKQMTAQGIPDNNRDRRVMIELLSSTDTTALALKRLTQDEEQAGEDNKTALLAARILSAVDGNPFKVGEPKQLNKPDTLEPGMVILDDEVTGEMDIGLSTDTYEQFMDKHNDK